MAAAYEALNVNVEPEARRLKAAFRLINRSYETWRKGEGFAVGWQIYDPETSTFICEGEWTPLEEDLVSAGTQDVHVDITLPPERGQYHVYLSPVSSGGWQYAHNQPFILLDTLVEHQSATLLNSQITTLRALRRRRFWNSVGKVFTEPVTSIVRNRSLISSMSRRDILSRYRGSFGDVLWTVLNPLLLMATYFFVFGIVLPSKFGADQSRTGFALYFLAGMLPWLPFAEAIGRAPNGILENRVLVKKVVFPVEILPVVQTISGIVTQAFAAALFLLALLLIRGSVPVSALWLPLILVPQLLFTLGLAWLLSATGVYLRDIGQMIGFFLTLWFFLTPICYPESSLPVWAAGILTKNPMYVLVRDFRVVLLEGHAPALAALAKLYLVAAVVFFGGYAWFHKLRKSFADVI